MADSNSHHPARLIDFRFGERRGQWGQLASVRWAASRKVHLCLGLTVFLLGACASEPEVVERVTVLNRDFEVVSVLEGGLELDRFNEIWAAKLHAKTPSENVTVSGWKLDVQVNGKSSRWLYSPNGEVVLLSVKLQPVYSLGAPSQINTILGL